MSDTPDPDTYDDIIDQIEGAVDMAEMAEDDPEVIDRYHAYQLALLDAGVDEMSLSPSTRQTLRQIVVYRPDLFDHVLGTVAKVHNVETHREEPRRNGPA